MSSKKLTTSQLRAFRSSVAKLKSQGLVGSKVDARSQKPTRYMLEQVNKYSDVLNGKAKAVHVPSAKVAKQFDGYRHKGKTVVVPAEKGERITYNKKTGEIRGHRTRGDKKITKIFAQAGKERPSGDNMKYTIPLGRPGERWTFDDWNELAAFFAEYEKNNKYPNWQKYVEFERVA